jgi:hypothetical protein
LKDVRKAALPPAIVELIGHLNLPDIACEARRESARRTGRPGSAVHGRTPRNPCQVRIFVQSFELPEADLVCQSISSISSLPLHLDPSA